MTEFNAGVQWLMGSIPPQQYLPVDLEGQKRRNNLLQRIGWMLGIFVVVLLQQLVPFYQYGLALMQGKHVYWIYLSLGAMLLIGGLELWLYRSVRLNTVYPQHWEKNKLLGADGWIYYLPVTVGFLLLINYVSTYMLAPVASNTSVNQQAVNQTIDSTPTLLILAMMIIGPIIEEYFYRGVLMNWFNTAKAGYTVISLVISSLIFAIAHASGGATPLYFMTIFISGLLLGETYRETNNLKLTIVIHIIYDILATFWL